METKTYNGYEIEIIHSDTDVSPREWCNIGYALTAERRYYSPDKNDVLMQIMKDTGDYANTAQEHIKGMTKRIKKEKEVSEKVLFIFPITKYEHSGVSYSVGDNRSCPFDSGIAGFYFVTQEKWTECMGKTRATYAKAKKIAQDEMRIYTQFCNGDLYGYSIEDENGDFVDSCGGFYETEQAIEEARQMVDYTIKDKIKKHVEKRKAQIRNCVPLAVREAL
jgi:hypothetical protein